MRTRRILGLAVGALGLIMACAPADQQDGGDTTEEPAPQVSAAPESLPGTQDAAELWAYLADSDYRSWLLWPGKGERYPGGEPHGSTLTTYTNATTASALEAGTASMPGGSIIVKENYMPSGDLGAITTMYKVEGYNPDAGDWYWVKFLPDGTVDMDGMAQGMVPTCIACHTGRADNDYIFTSDLGG